MGDIKAVIFDWGDTVMREFTSYPGPMVYWPKVELIPGISLALEQLHESFTCCLVSNASDSDSRLMALALSRVGVREHFDHLFTLKDLGKKKPNPRFFLTALQKLALEPDECVMVGDNYINDILAAKSVGMRTIWFSESDGDSGVPGADAIISSMDDLVVTVLRLRNLAHA